MREFAEFALAAFVASLAIEAVDTFAGRNTAWVLAFITLLLYLMYATGSRQAPAYENNPIFQMYQGRAPYGERK